ncbi:hypothetical protein GW7_13499 [Heterocephalus glaber]|uniref:Uncharacterized protein n=1 Tax=Heterocephalus glaber TaxID=10181 RepID=G5APP1_HETGA|nr:hypothetical protein GW7_13499 [Heterocephalus glaber]
MQACKLELHSSYPAQNCKCLSAQAREWGEVRTLRPRTAEGTVASAGLLRFSTLPTHPAGSAQGELAGLMPLGCRSAIHPRNSRVTPKLAATRPSAGIHACTKFSAESGNQILFTYINSNQNLSLASVKI